MSTPYTRYVRHTDDGCSIHQCLMCYSEWEHRGGSDGWKFCPFCGTKWNGQLECRPATTPRWLYEYEKRDGAAAARNIEARLWYPPEPKRGWVIESRSVCIRNSGKECGDWSILAKQGRWLCRGDALDVFRGVLRQLAAMRRDEAEDDFECTPRFRTEYRARIADLGGVIAAPLWRSWVDTRRIVDIWKAV